MNIGERILHLRKDVLKLNQNDFGKPLGIKKGGLSKIETGACNVTDANIISICREYSVNEEWLRDGTGDMLQEDENDLDFLVGKYGADLTDMQKEIFIAMLKMDDEQRMAVERFMDELISLRKNR